MQFRNLFPILMLAAALLAACAPQAVQSPAPAANPPQVTQAPAQVQSSAAVATSRGDKLEATDPTTVALASGGIQLVEFFRFT